MFPRHASPLFFPFCYCRYCCNQRIGENFSLRRWRKMHFRSNYPEHVLFFMNCYCLYHHCFPRCCFVIPLAKVMQADPGPLCPKWWEIVPSPPCLDHSPPSLTSSGKRFRTSSIDGSNSSHDRSFRRSNLHSSFSHFTDSLFFRLCDLSHILLQQFNS